MRWWSDYSGASSLQWEMVGPYFACFARNLSS
jgi:hypothetical protein